MANKRKKKPKGNQNLVTAKEWAAIKKFGENVKAQRNKNGWTLESMEERGYKSWKHWQDIEAGNRNISFTTALRIAKCLNVKVESLLKKV